MTKKALCLSGGGARGSFQMGAIRCLYDIYGFRPDVIAGTSAGAVNGIRLAVEPPPADNDPLAILREVAAGRRDPQSSAMLALHQEWVDFSSPDSFFFVGAPFRGTVIEDFVRGMNNPQYDEPMNVGVDNKIDWISVLINVPLAHLFAGPVYAAALQNLRSLIEHLASENALLNLTPVSDKLFDPMRINLLKLAAGTPLYLACVALESGRLRYATGQGRFVERDGSSPVMSALTEADVDAAFDENLKPLPPARAQRIKDLLQSHALAVANITLAQHEYSRWDTTPERRRALAGQIDREKQRGDYRLRALRAQLADVRITSMVDPRIGVLASASMPAYFDPPQIGTEHYVDGGIREIMPVRIVVDLGVDELIGVECSATTLTETASFDHAGVISVAARSLTDIALKEIAEGDMDDARRTGIRARFIVPGFDVHDTVVVQPSLIEISMHYGWLRACDVMQPATDSERAVFQEHSDLVSRLRLQCLELERYLLAHDDFSNTAGKDVAIARLRVLRWSIAQLCASRSRAGLPAHPQQSSWGVSWEREHRPTGPYGAASVWNTLSVTSDQGVTIVVMPATSAIDFAPDSGCIVDAGSDRVYWLVRGAVFYAPSDTQDTTAHLPVVVAPSDLHAYLPKIPTGTHVMAEAQDPAVRWLVRGGRRYRLNNVQWTATGLAAQPPALVPERGMNQIPDGGAPYWLGGLVVTDSQGQPIERWEPTPQFEGSDFPTSVFLTNRSTRPVRLTALDFASSQDSPGNPAFSLTRPLPIDFAASTMRTMPVEFKAGQVGPVNGVISVTCDDATVPQFSVPLTTTVRPIGEHGDLRVTPTSIDFGARRVGEAVGQNITLSNAGTRDVSIVDLRISDDHANGQFAVPGVWSTLLTPGQSDTVWVSCTPTARGSLRATLSIDAQSVSSSLVPYLQHHETTLTALAQAPVIFLAARMRSGTQLRPAGLPTLASPDIVRPLLPPGVRVEMELQTLDFGTAPPGGHASGSFWVRNLGDLPLVVQGIAIAADSNFSAADGTLFPVDIAPGGEHQVPCDFVAPTTAGTVIASRFTISSDDPARPMAALDVVGRAAGPHLAEPIELLEMGAGSPPPPARMSFTSDGSEPVTIKEIWLTGGTLFSLNGVPTLPLQLAPGATLAIGVMCTSTQPGQCRDTFIMLHDGKVSRRTQIMIHAERN